MRARSSAAAVPTACAKEAATYGACLKRALQDAERNSCAAQFDALQRCVVKASAARRG